MSASKAVCLGYADCEACQNYQEWLEQMESDRRHLEAKLKEVRDEISHTQGRLHHHMASHPEADVVHLKDRDTGRARCGDDSGKSVWSLSQPGVVICKRCRAAMLLGK